MNNYRQPLRKLEIDGIASLLGRRVSALFVPVFICMLFVAWSATNLSTLLMEENMRSFFAFFDEHKHDTISRKLGVSLINALITVAVVTAMTFLIFLLYKYRCIKILIGLLVFSTASTLFFVMWIWLDLFCIRFQIPYDFITAAFLLWNIGVVGLISIFYYSHPMLLQIYLVVVSIIAGWSLSFLPEWTTWLILIFIALYDVVAVLCPWGPLRMLIEMSQQRNETIPGLLYSSENKITVRSSTAATAPQQEAINHTNERRTEEPCVSADSREGDRNTSAGLQRRCSIPPAIALYNNLLLGPFKLGLGDFVFYSLLTARAAMFSFTSFVMSTVAVLVGLFGTLASLLLFRDHIMALPALPISICCGVVAFFLCRFVIVSFDWFLIESMLVL